ncbi:MAG: hypothetical protein J0L63_11560 [Anaerolineae bacterium]|nr:hypothetical protein [Anaerolineae bacterium]
MYPPLLTAGIGLAGAWLCRLQAGRWGFGAFGCGKTGVGCRHAAMAAGRGETAAGKEWGCAGSAYTAAEVRRHCRQIRQTMAGAGVWGAGW